MKRELPAEFIEKLNYFIVLRRYKIKMNQLLNDDDDAPAQMEYHLATPDRSDVSMLNASQFSS